MKTVCKVAGRIALTAALCICAVSCRKSPEVLVREAIEKVGALEGQGKYDEALAILDGVLKIERCAAYHPMVRGAILNVKVDRQLAAGDTAAADSVFRSSVMQAPNDAAALALGKIAESCEKAGARTNADAICRFVVDTFRDREELREAGCTAWLRLAARRGDLSELVTRLIAAKKEGISSACLLRQMEATYAALLRRMSKDDMSRILDLLQQIVDSADPADVRQQAAAMMLDFSFFLERFSVAVALLERADGITGHDPQSRKLMTIKAKAHLALQQGKPQEAVALFREFMGIIAAEAKEEIDPVEQSRVVPEMILGLNAKRIGDILAGAGDKDGAAKAYAEARDYYVRAQGKFGKDSREFGKIAESLKAIP